MDKKKRICKCPVQLQKVCNTAKGKRPGSQEVADIVQALTYQDYLECLKKNKKQKPPKFKTKKFVPPHFKDTCVPMKPSMHTRLNPLQPPRIQEIARRTYSKLTFGSSPEDSEMDSKGKVGDKRGARGKRGSSKDSKLAGRGHSDGRSIYLPTPAPVVRHSTSSKSIVNVPSPRTSGEIIRAQRAAVKPALMRPPLPAKSGHELFKPHSGIYLNKNVDFVPDVVHVPGVAKDVRRPKKPKPCYKGGVCLRKTCPRKKCRAYAAKVKKKKLAIRLKRRAESHRTVTDGMPRARSKTKYPDENDSVCGLDEIPKPEHIHIPPNLKRGTIQTHSLTVVRCTKDKRPDIHYGILKGTFNMYDSKFSARSRGRQALPMSVMAFCLAFHYHPKQWTMKLIDNLMDAADVWYIQCLDKVHDHSSVQGMCEVLQFGKKQILILNGKRMQILLSEPDIVGYTMSLDPTVYNLCRGLKAFFTENRAGILLSRVLKVVIWKDKVCYYIFDPAGRDSRAYSNFAQGQAALMNVKDIESVAEVLLARSILEDQKFILAPIKVLKMADVKCDEDFESDKELTLAEKAMMGYRMLNENYAIVNANMHLGDRCFEEAKFKQALPISIVAMTYAKISPPNSWFSKTLDKILRLGNKLYVDCMYPKVLIDISIDNIPNEIMIGPYACEIIIYRERVKGQLFTTKECIFNIRTGLADFFSHEYNSGILEFNNYVLAIWRQKDMFYLFDPYPRTYDGLRTMQPGRACCLMLLNTETMANAFTRNWDYLPATTQFHVHAFKVLKLKKKKPKIQLYCKLSDHDLPGPKKKRNVLPMSKAQGDGQDTCTDVLPLEMLTPKTPVNQADEEQMGDIISLVESIQEDYVPPIPLRYKKYVEEPMEPKVINLDSPTVSVTQVVPPWPKPRDKTNEPIEPDPDPEPTPPPTPPPAMPPEDAEEEEGVEEEEDEEKKEERARKKAAEEEALRKANELPPPLPPPPPSPQPEPEVPLAPMRAVEEEEEVPTQPAVNVDRRVLLTEDAQRRFKLRKIRKKMTPPLIEDESVLTPKEELEKPSNFKPLPDSSQIIRGTISVSKPGAPETIDRLPFGAIMAIVTSYKYAIHTWTPGIVDFVVDTSLKLYNNKQQRFQLAPIHVIPKIALGHQAYNATVDVVRDAPSWQMEDILAQKFLNKYDRGMITTYSYSCAFFMRNGLYYLFDGTPCNAMGLRDDSDQKGKACFLRFPTLHGLVSRINYNKDGKTEDQQFIISRILVRRLLKDVRTTLPEDHDYETGKPKSAKSKQTILASDKDTSRRRLDVKEKKSQTTVGYQLVDGVYRIYGTTALTNKGSSTSIKSCHFVCLIAMLMAAMHPIRTWDHVMIDVCIEKGLEIHEKAVNFAVCEKRTIKNIILDGKYININIRKILVVNKNKEKTLEQYLNAVMKRLRYVIITYQPASLVICQSEGYFHLFDPYPATQPPAEVKEGKKPGTTSPALSKKEKQAATWTLFRTIDALIRQIKKIIPTKEANNPNFYTFELTSVKNAPRHSAINYRLSPLFRPDVNPNTPYLRRRRLRPVVDEKMYWLAICEIPWSRMSSVNDLGMKRKTPQTMWKDWDIEFPGDLYSLWGTIHPLDERFDPNARGKQYLATSAIAIAMTQACKIGAWTSEFIDGIVIAGNEYHKLCMSKVGSKPNYEVAITDLDTTFNMFPFSFMFKYEKIIFGFVYNIYPDRFNLSKAMTFFYENEKNINGLLTSPTKNLAFGKVGASFFMFDCQSFGAPVFCPGQGAAYMLICESLNRLIYCMTLTLNIRRHGYQFHLFKVEVKITETSKPKPKSK